MGFIDDQAAELTRKIAEADAEVTDKQSQLDALRLARASLAAELASVQAYLASTSPGVK